MGRRCWGRSWQPSARTRRRLPPSSRKRPGTSRSSPSGEPSRCRTSILPASCWTVAGQTDPDWDLAPLMDFPERLALESGRPVLVVPYIGRYPEIGRNVVIAWKAGRESARAVFDALPILTAAEKVHILEIKEKGDKGGGALAPDTTIAASLARHGIKPSVRTSIAADISVGDEILSRIA